MAKQSRTTTITSEGVSAKIASRGAELVALSTSDGDALLWGPDPSVWDATAPLMFPIVGRLVGDTYRVSEEQYQLPIHGFARSKHFQLVDANSSMAQFRLCWDEETIAVYPFRFVLDLIYSVSGATLTMTMAVKNVGAEAMPASFGFHPALRWPLPFSQSRSAHLIMFEREEPSAVRRQTHRGTINPQLYFTPVVGRLLQLNDELFRNDALIFDKIASRTLWYGSEIGPNIQVDFPDMPCLSLWSKPGAEFICIEPTHGYADPEGFSGDFWDKPGIFIVEPGREKRGTMSISHLGNTGWQQVREKRNDPVASYPPVK
jgi:galactose mutarotase-like enzyme